MVGILVDYCQKGGISSWKNRRKNPEHYRSLGCIVANTFSYPDNTNPEFAEFIGITLGDGGITHSQLCITLNKTADSEYIKHVVGLIKKLFGYTPSVSGRHDSNAVIIRITGVDFIKFLIKSGLSVGNKVKQQVGVPEWITVDPILSANCMRGLIDTDGCVFINRYQINNKWYQYRKLAFSNRSQPLLGFVYSTLKHYGITSVYYQNKQIRICSETDTKKYMETIKSSNERLLKYFY